MVRKVKVSAVRWLALALVCLVTLLAVRSFSAPRLSPRAQAAADMLKRQRHWRQAVREGDVPKLSNVRAPWGTAWRNSLALCSTVRQENATDLREWLMHYRCALLLGGQTLAAVHPTVRSAETYSAALQCTLVVHLFTIWCTPGTGSLRSQQAVLEAMIARASQVVAASPRGAGPWAWTMCF
jgi:hypothetical protein